MEYKLYRSITQPLIIIGIPFDFLAVLLLVFTAMYTASKIFSIYFIVLVCASIYVWALRLTKKDPNWYRVLLSNIIDPDPKIAFLNVVNLFRSKIYAP